MQGGEYLNVKSLIRIWEELNAYLLEELSSGISVYDFLKMNAPKWKEVARVFFHLAENKKDDQLPFAFMVTYTSGMSSAGRLQHLPLSKALIQYSGENNHQALINLLSPIHKASRHCTWIKSILDDSSIYQVLAWDPDDAYNFLSTVPILEESGISVRLPNWWKKRNRAKVEVSIGKNTSSFVGMDAMLDFNVSLALGDQNLTPEETKSLLEGKDGLVLFKGQWIEVDQKRLQEALQQWESIKDSGTEGEISFIEGMRLLAGTSHNLDNAEFIEENQSWVDVQSGEALQNILTNLRCPENLHLPELENNLQTSLRPYQREGSSWLHFLTSLGLGACLADDMGLGKTIQVLALLLYHKSLSQGKKQKPSLLILPASLLANWKEEAARFAPSLSLFFIHPSQNKRSILDAVRDSAQIEEDLSAYDLVITTYSYISRLPSIHDISWHYLILDEAQAIKNAGSKQTKTVKKLKSFSRIALTGTPVENKMGDLWSLFDFLNKGLLGNSKIFTAFMKKINNAENPNYSILKKLVSPYILRRMKTDKSIISDLPDKTEVNTYCNLSKLQLRLYIQIVNEMKKALENTEGIARKGLVMQSLMRLKQVCNHPSQLLGESQYLAENSGKFLRIASICEEIAERQEKVLIFSQFREIIEPLAEHLSTVFKKDALILHGGTSVKKRKDLVDSFQNDENSPFFIISLKAGGTGLNLTAASHVIHFDRWWNPAVENQATDRAFRIGQKNNVLVHKFVTEGTIENKIDQMISEKQDMANNILSGKEEIKLTELSNDELINLVQVDINQSSLEGS